MLLQKLPKSKNTKSTKPSINSEENIVYVTATKSLDTEGLSPIGSAFWTNLNNDGNGGDGDDDDDEIEQLFGDYAQKEGASKAAPPDCTSPTNMGANDQLSTSNHDHVIHTNPKVLKRDEGKENLKIKTKTKTKTVSYRQKKSTLT